MREPISMNRVHGVSGSLALLVAVGWCAALSAGVPVATGTASHSREPYGDGPGSAGQLVLERERFVYPVHGRRDPFKPLAVQPADGDAVAGLQVLGIIYHRIPRHSLVLLRAGGEPGVDAGAGGPGADGLRAAEASTHRLRTGDTLGPLRIVRIRHRQVVVDLTDGEGVTRRVLEAPRPVRRSGT